MMLLVFLDFDGCLRRASSPKYRLEPHLVERFELWVREQEIKHGEVEIVVSSSWKDAFSLDEIREQFRSAYLSTRVRAKTPTLAGDREHVRYDEIRLYLKKNEAENLTWVAIDDQRDLFPPGLDNIIVCDPEIGFDP